jgi:hypothetical protein
VGHGACLYEVETILTKGFLAQNILWLLWAGSQQPFLAGITDPAAGLFKRINLLLFKQVNVL